MYFCTLAWNIIAKTADIGWRIAVYFLVSLISCFCSGVASFGAFTNGLKPIKTGATNAVPNAVIKIPPISPFNQSKEFIQLIQER